MPLLLKLITVFALGIFVVENAVADVWKCVASAGMVTYVPEKAKLADCVKLNFEPIKTKRWTKVATITDGDFYIDNSTIRKKGNIVKMWDLMDYRSTQNSADGEFLSDKAQSEYDCKEEKRRLLVLFDFSGHTGDGKVVFSDLHPDSEWYPVEPESVEESLWEIACGKR